MHPGDKLLLRRVPLSLELPVLATGLRAADIKPDRLKRIKGRPGQVMLQVSEVTAGIRKALRLGLVDSDKEGRGIPAAGLGITRYSESLAGTEASRILVGVPVGYRGLYRPMMDRAVAALSKAGHRVKLWADDSRYPWLRVHAATEAIMRLFLAALAADCSRASQGSWLSRVRAMTSAEYTAHCVTAARHEFSIRFPGPGQDFARDSHGPVAG